MVQGSAADAIIAGDAILYRGFCRDDTRSGLRFVRKCIGFILEPNNRIPSVDNVAFRTLGWHWRRTGSALPPCIIVRHDIVVHR